MKRLEQVIENNAIRINNCFIVRKIIMFSMNNLASNNNKVILRERIKIISVNVNSTIKNQRKI